MTPLDRIILIRNLRGFCAFQKIILIMIASHLGENEFAFLSLSTLANECGIGSKQNLINHLKKLISENIVIKIPPSDGFKSNRYSINFDLLISILNEQDQSRSETSLGAILVSERDSTSLGARQHQSRSETALVSERDTKRNIKEIKRKLKEREEPEPSLSVDDFQFDDYEKNIAQKGGLELMIVFEKFKHHLGMKGRSNFPRSEWKQWLIREIEYKTIPKHTH